MKRRLFSLLLAVCMLLMILPATSLAEEIPSAPAEAGAATPVQDGDATPSASPAQSPAAEEEQKPQEEVRIEPVQPDDVYLTVVFQDKDGGEIATVIVKNGESVSAPAAPEVPGSKFVGWYAGEIMVSFPRTADITADDTMIVQARYDGALYVFFHSHDGSIVETRSGKTGDVISVSGVSYPLAGDQSITGWCTDTALKNPVNSVTLETSNIDLYAKVEGGYWITFESNGGSYVEPMFFAVNTDAQPPAAPVKHGYAFAGWYTDEGLAQPANFEQIKASTKLYAKWTEHTDVQYTVQHMIENADNDDYSLMETETKRGQTGALTRATAKMYDGFTAQAITQETINGDGSTMVKVYYKRNVYRVTFWSIKDVGFIFSKYVKDKEFTEYRITAKHGANISDKWPGGNWTTSPGGDTYQSNIDTMPLGGDEFFKTNQQGNAKAYYYLEDLKGSFVLDHTDLGPDNTSVTNEDRYPITGFTCNTAKSAKNGDRYNGAKFYYNRNTYNIVFVSGGSTVKTVQVKYQQDISDQDYTPTNPPKGKEDHTFDGWYEDSACTCEFVFKDETMPAYNITLYAGWDGRDYTVIAHGKSDLPVTVEKGDTVSPDQFASVIPDVGEGETFMGWTEQQGSTRLFNFATQITRDIHLYPVIMDGKTYTLTYHPNGGMGTVPTDSNKYAKGTYAQVVSGSGLTRQGMIFLGWSTDQNAVSPAYYPGGSVKINDNTTLYAVWGTPTGKAAITYHSNFGNDQTRKSEDKPINSLITVEGYGNLNLPSRTGYEFTGWNTASDGNGTAYAAGATARLTAGGNDLYAQWKAGTYSYTVEYYIDGKKDDSLTVTAQAAYNAEISTYLNKCPENYKFEKVENCPLTIGVNENENVIRVYYVKNVFTLTIHYLYAEDGTAAEDHVESFVQGAAYSVTSPKISGYTVDKATVSGSMPAKDVTETVTYTKRSDLSYTVNYYWNGTETKVKESKKVDGKTFQESVTESPVTIEGYTSVSNGPATIIIGVGNNVINFFYYKNVELTANSGSFTYNGQPHTVEGYTCDTAGVNFEGITAAETQTAVGTYPVNFAGNPVGKIDATAKYIVVEANPGALVITAHAGEVVVMIRGNSDTKVYDGMEYTVTDYVVESISNTLYTENDFTFSGTAKAKRTRFGKTEMGLKPENFTNTNQSFTKVTFVVKDGYIDITKRPLNLVGETATKPYTGSSISLDQFTPENLAEGDAVQSISYLATGIMPNEYPGEFNGTLKIVNGNDDDVTDCYEVTRIPGKLTITKATEPVTVKIVGNTKTVTYNGSEQSVEGFTADVGNKPITVTLKEGHKAEAKGTLPNKYSMKLKAEDFDIKSDVYENFEVSVEDGWLQIEPTEAEVTVTITGNRRTVTYNGSEQSVEGFTTDVGDKPITVMLKDGGKAEAKGRYVGRYMMGLTVGDFKVDSTVYKNVKVIVIDGYLDIQPVYNPSVYPDYDPTPTPSPSYVPDPYRSPKTGDDSRIALWLTLMGLSAAAIAGVIVFDKKRRRS